MNTLLGVARLDRLAEVSRSVRRMQARRSECQPGGECRDNIAWAACLPALVVSVVELIRV